MPIKKNYIFLILFLVLAFIAIWAGWPHRVVSLDGLHELTITAVEPPQAMKLAAAADRRSVRYLTPEEAKNIPAGLLGKRFDPPVSIRTDRCSDRSLRDLHSAVQQILCARAGADRLKILANTAAECQQEEGKRLLWLEFAGQQSAAGLPGGEWLADALVVAGKRIYLRMRQVAAPSQVYALSLLEEDGQWKESSCIAGSTADKSASNLIIWALLNGKLSL